MKGLKTDQNKCLNLFFNYANKLSCSFSRFEDSPLPFMCVLFLSNIIKDIQ